MGGVKKSVSTETVKKKLEDGSVEVQKKTVTKLTYEDGTSSEKTEVVTEVVSDTSNTEFGKWAEFSKRFSDVKPTGMVDDVGDKRAIATDPEPRDLFRPAKELQQVVGAFEVAALNKHNEYRKLHQASPLVLDQKLNELAQDWANQLMRKLVANGGNAILSHRPDNEWGENVAYTWTSRSVHELDAKEKAQSAIDAVKSWYSEIGKYDFNVSRSQSGTGHFTQVVWKDSKRLGMGVAYKDGHTFVVANYGPAGNFWRHENSYKDNVLPKIE